MRSNRSSILWIALLSASCRLPAQTPSAALDVSAIAAQALAVNPTARAAQQRLVEAQAVVGAAVAQGRLQPSFNGSVSGANGRVAQPSSYETFYTVIGTLTLPLPDAGRLSASSALARAQLRAAQADLDRTRQDLIFRANDAYYGALRARGAEQIARDNLDQAERQVADTQKRVDAGDIAPAEVLKAQVPASQTRLALARAQSATRIAEQTLNSLLNRDIDMTVNLAAAPSLPPFTLTREQVTAQALANSPDAREAQSNLDAAVAAVRVARHGRDPEYSAQASYTNTSDITAYNNLATVTLNVTIPLGDGGLARQQTRQAQARLEQARSALELARQQARLAAAQAFLDVETDQASITATQETVRIAQDSLDKARQAFTAGLTTTRDVLDAQLALALARSDANAALYDLAVARARLDQAMGRL